MITGPKHYCSTVITDGQTGVGAGDREVRDAVQYMTWHCGMFASHLVFLSSHHVLRQIPEPAGMWLFCLYLETISLFISTETSCFSPSHLHDRHLISTHHRQKRLTWFWLKPRAAVQQHLVYHRYMYNREVTKHLCFTSLVMFQKTQKVV